LIAFTLVNHDQRHQRRTRDTADAQAPQGDSRDLCAAPGPVGFTNLVVSTRGGQVELDPHAAGACKITLEEDGARVR
jgi:hypothetical protein